MLLQGYFRATLTGYYLSRVRTGADLEANVEDISVGGVAAVLATLQALVCHAQAVELCVLHIGDVVGVLIALLSAAEELSCLSMPSQRSWACWQQPDA